MSENTYDNDNAYCFICHRCTDHVGEHDYIVEDGMAVYEGNNVILTNTYNEARAIELTNKETVSNDNIF